MPLYEYKCQKCGKTLEAIRKFADAPLTICPHCGGELKKLFSSPAIKFKGSGFYINDYARNGKTDGKTVGKTDGKTEGKTEGKADGGKESSGGESKSESKSDSAATTESKRSGSSASEE